MTTSSQTEAPAVGGSVVDSSVGKPSQPTHPVDSTTCPSCKAIGGHLPDCVTDPDQTIAMVLHFKGAVITLSGTASDVEETWRRILDCPEWCVRDHLNERYSEDVELHQGETRWVEGAETADKEKLGVVMERDKMHGDGSGGLRVLIHGDDRGHFVDLEPTSAIRLATAMVEAAEQLEAEQ